MRQARFLRAGPRGETLIEGMVALAVFSVGLLGVLQMNIVASGQNAFALRQTTATMIARDLVDALERIPYDHTLLRPGPASPTAPGFADLDAADTHRLGAAANNERPLLGAAHAAYTVEGGARVYEVGWRVAQARDAGGHPEALHVVVMVRFRVPVIGTRQVELWTVKYNPAVVVGSPNATLEI